MQVADLSGKGSPELTLEQQDDPNQGVAFVRNHCRYPFRNVYVGPQNYTSPEAWKCLSDSF